MKALILLLACLIVVQISQAQSTGDSLEVGIAGLYTNDTIRLRWAPLNYQTYLRALEYGWKLERGIYRDTSGQVPDEQTFESGMVTLKSTYTVTDSSQWQSISGVNQDFLDASYELLFNSEQVDPDADTLNIFDALETVSNRDNVLIYANIFADRSWIVAENLAWAYLDAGIDSGFEYAYRLTLFGPGSMEKVFYGLISTEEEIALVKPSSPATEGADSLAGITMWISNEMEELYYGYEIQRSSDSGSSFYSISDAPFYYLDEREDRLFKTIDSLPGNDTIYQYRIRGLTRFGIAGPWSDTVSVQGIDGPLDAEPYITGIADTTSGVLIDFGFPAEFQSKIQGFEVIRSFDRNGPFLIVTDQLLSPSIRQYIDEDPIGSAYYFVRAIDENGYGLLSLPAMYQAVDTIPPIAPSNLLGGIDNTGKVELTWSKNPELDVRGYRVFASNAETALFVEITPGAIKDTTFTYQLNPEVLNENWYVKIRAVDHHENDGPFSQILELDRPDIVPPVAPVLKDVEVLANGTGINWVLSNDEDAISQVLERKEIHGGWQELLDITNNYTGPVQGSTFLSGQGEKPLYNYIDTTVEANRPYSYRILAYDDAGNVSSSKIVSVAGYDDGIRGQIVNLTVGYDDYTQYTPDLYDELIPDKTKVYTLLEWDYTEPEDLHSFIIYRSVNNFPFDAYQSFLVQEIRKNPATTGLNAVELIIINGSSSDYAFLDNSVKSGNRYRYKIIARHIDNTYSEMSSVVTVLVP